MAVDAVIFDFGGVFVDSPFTAVQTAAGDMGVAPEVMLDTVFGPYDQDTDHAWHRLERGEISLEVARAEIIEASLAAGLPELDPIALLMALGGGGVRDEMVEFCRSLRGAGCRDRPADQQRRRVRRLLATAAAPRRALRRRRGLVRGRHAQARPAHLPAVARASRRVGRRARRSSTMPRATWRALAEPGSGPCSSARTRATSRPPSRRSRALAG